MFKLSIKINCHSRSLLEGRRRDGGSHNEQPDDKLKIHVPPKCHSLNLVKLDQQQLIAQGGCGEKGLVFREFRLLFSY